MKLLMFALALALQSPSQSPAPTPPRPLPSELVPPALTPAHDLYFEDSQRLSPVALGALHRFSACVAQRSPQLVADTLQRDFTSTRYRNALRLLARNNEDCFDRRYRRRALRASGLPFAGALAEHLLARDEAPLNIRLARAATGPALPPYSATDRLSLCLVRSVPDEVGRLLATAVGSPEEAAALRALELPVRICGRDGPRIEAPPAALRAMIATAAYRTLAGTGSEEGSN
jgi:hypothetical protein